MKKIRILFREKMSKQFWGYLSNLVKWVLNKISLIDIKDWPMTIMGSKHLTVFPKFNINVMTDLLNSNLFDYHWLKQKKSVNTFFFINSRAKKLKWNDIEFHLTSFAAGSGLDWKVPLQWHFKQVSETLESLDLIQKFNLTINVPGISL